MRILYVCHRFPFPPKRGGKIRPFNMIRHLARDSTRSRSCSLARSQRRGARRARASRRTARASRWRGSASRCRRCAWWRGCRRRSPSSMGYFYSARARAPHPCAAGEPNASTSIFVHCSSVAQYVARRARHAEDPRLRRHGFAEVARVRALQAVPAVARLLARRAQAASARSAASRAASTCARPRRAPSGRRSRATARRARPTGFRTAWTASSSRPTTDAARSGHDLLRRADGLLSEPGVHVRLLRATCCRVLQARRPDAEAAHRRRRSVAGGAEARRAARRHGDRFRARRASLRALGRR